MRQQLLHGYVLHQRPYRENSRLVQYFCMESGRVDGVARQALPALYQPSLLYANGKTSLKTFAKIEAVGHPVLVSGQGLMAGFYLNELLVRLLELEEPCLSVFASYASSIDALQQLPAHADAAGDQALRAVLRRFEWTLLEHLGSLPSLTVDQEGQPIDPKRDYRYVAGQGLSAHAKGPLPGAVLQTWSVQTLQADVPDPQHLQVAAQVLRAEISRQLGGKPLHSRELWRQMQARRD